MGILKRSRFFGVSFVLGTILFLVFGFNNCGRGPSAAQQAAQPMTFDSQVEAMATKYQRQLDPKFCFNSENYSCAHKVFSQSVDFAAQPARPHCVQLLEGGEICPSTQELTYNSQSAQAGCKENCAESYEIEETDCHIKLGPTISGTFPLIANEIRFEDAVEKIFQACQKIQRGSP